MRSCLCGELLDVRTRTRTSFGCLLESRKRGEVEEVYGALILMIGRSILGNVDHLG